MPMLWCVDAAGERISLVRVVGGGGGVRGTTGRMAEHYGEGASLEWAANTAAKPLTRSKAP
jgi:hypothetical protein